MLTRVNRIMPIVAGAMAWTMTPTGLAQTGTAQPPAHPTTGKLSERSPQHHQQQHQRFDPMFADADDLIGSEITILGAEGAGELDDLVVDMRTGRVVYAVIDTGDLVESADGRTVALPYAALSWNQAGENFVLRADAQQIRSLSDFDRNALVQVSSPSWISTMRSIFGDQPDLAEIERTASNDEYTACFAHGKMETIEGTIQSVDFMAPHRGEAKRTIVTVVGDDGQTHRVMLAPQAYLMQEGPMPASNQTITVEAAPTTDIDGTRLWVAREMSLLDRERELRTEAGVPVWTTARESTGRFFAYASALDDGDLYAGGKAFGDIEQIIVETNSGRVCFVTVGAGGVLGLNEDDYIVPFEALHPSTDGNLLVRLSAAELEKAPTLSENGIEDLHQQGFRDRVYRAFGVNPPTLDTRRTHDWKSQPHRSTNDR